MTDICTQSPNPVQDIQAGPPEYLLRGMAKERFCSMIPETNLARFPDGKDCVRCIFEKGEQFRFQHVHILVSPGFRWDNGSEVQSMLRTLKAHTNLLGIDLGLVGQGQVAFYYRVQVRRISAERL